MRDLREEAVKAFKIKNVPDSEAMRQAALDQLRATVTDESQVAIGDVREARLLELTPDVPDLDTCRKLTKAVRGK